MKKYHLLLFIATIIYSIALFYEIYNNNMKSYLNKIDNVGNNLAERILNINKIRTSQSGLYKEDNRYIFKGNSNNYILFSNNLWRIVSLEKDGTVKIVLDDILEDYNIDDLDTKYYNSLNNKFITYHEFNLTNYDYSELKTKEDISKIDEYFEKHYIGLLDLKDVVNAALYADFDEYLNMYFWLYKDSNYLYYNQEYRIYNNMYAHKDFIKNGECKNLRPALYLNSNLYLLEGKGTKDNPYVLKEEQ